MFEFGKKTYIMGILNVTPDSFSDGGEFNNLQSAMTQARKMMEEGADILDLGAESTRPGSKTVDAKEEIQRLGPILNELSKIISIPISVDTYKAQVADFALNHGATIINDVWGLQKDLSMADVAAKYQCYTVVMHNKEEAYYEGDIVKEIKNFFQQTIKIAKKAGLQMDKLILDPGIGFGKTAEDNLKVLRRLNEIKEMGYPVLLGASRKSTLGKILDLPPKERVEGTIATTVIGISQGVDIVRVHDVKENKRAAMVSDAVYRGANG